MAKEETTADTTIPPPDAERGVSTTSLDQDVAIKLVGEHAQEIDPLVEARALKKIDWFLIPAMIIGTSPSLYFLDEKCCSALQDMDWFTTIKLF
jgi:hypothetical protein